MRNNVKALAKFTVDELNAEVARRLSENTEWGFVILEEDDDDDRIPRFGIVAIDEWNKSQYLGDYSLGDRVSLPKGFTEVRESTYEYRGGDLYTGKKLLIQAGFLYLGVL